jgi:hypothetical protein
MDFAFALDAREAVEAMRAQDQPLAAPFAAEARRVLEAGEVIIVLDIILFFFLSI